MKTIALAVLVVMLLILLGVFWADSKAAETEASWLFGWLKLFALGGLALLALLGAGYYVAGGQSKSRKFQRLFLLLLALGALLVLAALIVAGAAVGSGLGGKDGQGMFGLLLFPR
jgi:cytochrome bd-type quinol oxidase subunit 2